MKYLILLTLLFFSLQAHADFTDKKKMNKHELLKLGIKAGRCELYEDLYSQLHKAKPVNSNLKYTSHFLKVARTTDAKKAKIPVANYSDLCGKLLARYDLQMKLLKY